MDSNLTIIWLCNSMGTDFRRCSEIDEEMKQKLNEMHVGRLIHILSHTMKRHNPAEVMENDDLTTMQKHVLKFILWKPCTEISIRKILKRNSRSGNLQ